MYDPAAVPLPRPLVGSGELHFSFAGLKSAVQRAVYDASTDTYRPLYGDVNGALDLYRHGARVVELCRHRRATASVSR